jgi:LysM repeat protein
VRVVWLFALAACISEPPVAPEPVTYVVKRGDTLFVIAREHAVDLQALKAANHLASDRIEVGQTLIIPTSSPAAPKPARGRPRTRSTGATLSLAPEGQAEEALEPTGPVIPDLQMPAARKCLAGPTGEGLGDDGAAASEGLDEGQVRAAMNGFVPHVQSCLGGLSAAPTGTLLLEVSVGCDGRVTGVRIEGQDDWPDAHAACIAQTLGFAPFPAHALPDGDQFLYPLRMQ